MSSAAPLTERRPAKVWYVLGVGLILAVVVASLLPPRDLPRLHVSDKAEHFVAYFCLMLWFGGLVRLRHFAWLVLALLALGGGIEIVQGLMGLGREADWRDFFADAYGAGAGLLLALAGLRHWVRWLELWPRRA
jgi:VanZ family protein